MIPQNTEFRQPHLMDQLNRLRAEKTESRKRKNSRPRFLSAFQRFCVAPFDQIEWERRTAEITDDSSQVIFNSGHRGPEKLEPLATKIAVSKYFYGDIANGTNPHKGGRELGCGN